MKEEKEFSRDLGARRFHGRRGGGGNVRIRCQAVAYNDHRVHPVLIYSFMSSPVCCRSLIFYLPLGSPELDRIWGCGECLDYGEGKSEQ
jgi:hypothetical protein